MEPAESKADFLPSLSSSAAGPAVAPLPRPGPYTPDLRFHLPALDAVRGLAILMVTFYRFLEEPAESAEHGRLVFKLLEHGDRGVDLFFVLSGFLITGILFDAKGAPHYFRNFYIRRCLRIVPLYYGVLFLAFVLLPLAAPLQTLPYAESSPYQAWLWLYGANLFQAWTASWSLGWFNHFWSLAVEEHFYLIWPLLIFFCARKAALRTCVGCIAVAVACRVGLALSGPYPIAAEVLTPCRLDALGLGGLLALVARSPQGVRALAPWGIGGLVCLGLLVLLSWGGRGPGRWPESVLTLRYTLFAGFFGTVLIGAIRADPTGLPGYFWNLRVLRFFGKHSYAMYVFQSPLKPVFRWLFPVEGLILLSGSVFLGSVLFILFATTGTVAVAWLSWHLYEKHFLKLKALFPSRRDG